MWGFDIIRFIFALIFMSNFVNNHPKRPKFQRIGLMGRAGKKRGRNLNELIVLLDERDLSIVIDTETAAIEGLEIDFDKVDGNQFKIVPRQRLASIVILPSWLVVMVRCCRRRACWRVLMCLCWA